MKAPDTNYTFGALNLYGNPVNRPQNSASVCQDLRVMPGQWLRLRSGRIARCNLTSAWDVVRIEPLAFGGALGNSTHFAQVVYGSTDARAMLLTISGGTITAAESGIEQLCHQYSHFNSQPIPFALLPDAFVFGNGYGYHGSNLEPIPFLSWYDSAGMLRYFGMNIRPDSQRSGAPGGPPGYGYTTGSGEGTGTLNTSGGPNSNKVDTSITIYVGLYNVNTGHYSNGWKVATVPPSANGVLRVNSVGAINYATHGSSETAELYYVFYATLDGGEVPYLILDGSTSSADITGAPFKVSVSSPPASVYLNCARVADATDNGWYLDTTKIMPTKNFAPRQMSCIWYTNGRLYGIPYEFYDQSGTVDVYQFGGASTLAANDTMEITSKDQGSVCWSVAEGDVRTKQFVGDPLQSWPFNNISPAPSGERPIWGCAAPNGVDSMVWTASRLFLLKEQSDGKHEWDCIADTHGLFPNGQRTVKRTNYGIAWVSQRKQLMLYEGGGKEGIKVLSKEYDSILKAQTPVCAGYFFDPVNFVDRYEVFWSTGSVCHDFHVGGYTTTQPHAVRSSAMLVNPSGDTYLLIAAGTVNNRMGIYSVEGQADVTSAVPNVDVLFSGSSGSGTSSQELPEGYWAPNWLDYGSPLLRKELLEFHLLGDGELSTQLSSTRPIRIELFADFQQFVINGGSMMTSSKENQSATDRLYVFKPAATYINKRWLKFLVRIRSHSTEAGGSYFADPAYQGDYLGANFYGSVVAMLTNIGRPLNYR